MAADFAAAAEAVKQQRHLAETSGPARRRGPLRLLIGLGVLVVGLIALAVRAFVLHDNLEFWNYAWLTAPVAAAGGYLGYRLALGRGLGLGHISGLVVGTLGTSYLTGLTGGQGIGTSMFGGADITCLIQNTCTPDTLPVAASAPTNPLESATRIAQNYWQLYGPVGIISAVAAGLVVGIGFALVVNRNAARSRPL
jgi:hypothetical protein